jgi:hypothetical protein
MPATPSDMKFYALMMFLIISGILIYIIWIKPTISIIQNSKDIYQSSLDKMDKTYGTAKQEAEQSAQSSLDTWNASVNKMYKIIIETLLSYGLILFNYYDTRSNLYITGATNIVLIGSMIFEYVSNLLNNWLKQTFNNISSSASKNTQDNTGEHHKMLALFISGTMCLASILGKIKYGDDLFLSSAGASFVLSMLTLFNADFNSMTALICFSILGVLSVIASIHFESVILFTVFVISAIISILSALNVSTFDSEPYIFILFFLANIPFVSLFMYSLDLKNSKNDSLYIPLLIAFYILSIILLTILGAVDLTLNTNLYIILSVIGASILYYAKSLQDSDSVYKTFLLVVTMIVFFFIALHYVLVSQQWIVYLIAFILIMYFIMKRLPPPSGQGVQAVSKITNKEIVLISGEILFVLTYIYVRSIVKRVYTTHGQLIVNNPVSLHQISVVKIDKSVTYDYGLSFWLYIDPMNPSSSPQATNYTTIFSYGDAPTVTYNSMLNTLRIGIKTESKKIKKVDEIKKLPLQKWNHIVLNYLNGTCDVFVNSKLHASKIEVIPMKEQDRIFEIGAEDGIQGQLCNVIFFQEHLTGLKIKELYTEFSYKNPPTI